MLGFCRIDNIDVNAYIPFVENPRTRRHGFGKEAR